MIRYIIRQLGISTAVFVVLIIGAFIFADILAYLYPRIPSQRRLQGAELAGQVMQDTQGFLAAALSGRFSPQTTLQTEEGWKRSAGLLAVALVISIGAGLWLGLKSISPMTGRTRLGAVLLALIGISTPSFYWAMLLQLALVEFVVMTGRIAVGTGNEIPPTPLPVYGFGFDRHLVLPGLALAAWPTAQIARMTAQLLAEEFRQDYVRTARAKGLAWSWINARHLWPNIASGVVSVLIGMLPLMISSQLLIEWMFGWKGAGEYMLAQLRPSGVSGQLPMMRPIPETFAVLTAELALIFLPLYLLLSTGLRLLDPRLRSGGS